MYPPTAIAERYVLDHYRMHVGLAPETVQAASKAADDAYITHLNTIDLVDDTTLMANRAPALWAAEAIAARRKNKPLPSKDNLELSKIDQQLALEIERDAARLLSSATQTVLSNLRNETTRDEWRAAVETRLSMLQQALGKMAAEVTPIVAEVKDLLGLTRYLGAFGEHLDNPGPTVDVVEPATALRKLSNLKPWAPAEKLDDTPKVHQPAVDDTRPPVFIVNEGGAVHDVTAAHADRLANDDTYRLATADEISRYQARFSPKAVNNA